MTAGSVNDESVEEAGEEGGDVSEDEGPESPPQPHHQAPRYSTPAANTRSKLRKP